MRESNVVGLSGRVTIADPMTELLRAGSEQLIYPTLESRCAGPPFGATSGGYQGRGRQHSNTELWHGDAGFLH